MKQIEFEGKLFNLIDEFVGSNLKNQCVQEIIIHGEIGFPWKFTPTFYGVDAISKREKITNWKERIEGK